MDAWLEQYKAMLAEVSDKDEAPLKVKGGSNPFCSTAIAWAIIVITPCLHRLSNLDNLANIFALPGCSSYC